MAYKYGVISVDSHITITNEALLRHVPSNIKESASEFLTANSGNPIGSSGTEQKVREDWMWPALGRVGQRDPEERLKDMDLDGIDVEVLYTQGDAYSMPAGDPPAVDGMRLLRYPDQDARMPMIEAYNSALSEWIAASPDRLVPVGIVPLIPIDAAVKEIARLKRLGFRTIRIEADPPEGEPPLWHEQWDPIWRAAVEANFPISIHLGNSKALAHLQDPTPGRSLYKSLPPLMTSAILGSFILIGPLNRFPDLRIVLVEAGIGWIPYYIERMDTQWKRHGFRNRGQSRTDAPPSEVWRRQCYATFEEDQAGIRLLDLLGADRVMWASDYPHPDSTFPESARIIEQHFKECTSEQKHLVTYANAAHLYGLS